MTLKIERGIPPSRIKSANRTGKFMEYAEFVKACQIGDSTLVKMAQSDISKVNQIALAWLGRSLITSKAKGGIRVWRTA